MTSKRSKFMTLDDFEASADFLGNWSKSYIDTPQHLLLALNIVSTREKFHNSSPQQTSNQLIGRRVSAWSLFTTTALGHFFRHGLRRLRPRHADAISALSDQLTKDDQFESTKFGRWTTTFNLLTTAFDDRNPIYFDHYFQSERPVPELHRLGRGGHPPAATIICATGTWPPFRCP